MIIGSILAYPLHFSELSPSPPSPSSFSALKATEQRPCLCVACACASIESSLTAHRVCLCINRIESHRAPRRTCRVASVPDHPDTPLPCVPQLTVSIYLSDSLSVDHLPAVLTLLFIRRALAPALGWRVR
mmetsp:Transcript_49244/g.128480  ORF Transcript_49244/g.128480 Transcript_49244/m.128480 type:complete len:130 (-) Transcript_49244:1784-2173(-)